jgi:uncharacterized lipoprotein YddW (UPF0748 family)
MKRLSLFILLAVLTQLTAGAQQNLKREFRGVWVATVGNIDWPSSNQLSSDEQRKEITELLDMLDELNFNAVIFQVRPAADAFYRSRHEPWSSYLTGRSDRPPAPYYDPLAFIIQETHKRGMEFHAWLNPYRAVINYREYRPNPLPVTYEKPEWFINYGDNKYFDPGNPEVRSYTLNVVKDIVQNYDIDAIHFDDYFYPYKINGAPFPDERSFETYGGSFYPDRLEDWRRDNVNRIILQLREQIKSLKPWVQLGISPFGVWRNADTDPRGSQTEAGQTNYDDLYADILHWVKNGWLNYVLPKAYWHIGHEKADYEEIVRWWSENSLGANLYIGHGLFKLNAKQQDPSWKQKLPSQIERQLQMNKSISAIKGSAYFSAKTLVNNPLNIRQVIHERFYQNPCLPPVSNNDRKNAPEPVYDLKLDKIKKNYTLSWKFLPENKEKEAVKFLVYAFGKGEPKDLNDGSRVFALTGQTQIQLSKKQLKEMGSIVIRAVSRNNDLSDPSTYQFNP